MLYIYLSFPVEIRVLGHIHCLSSLCRSYSSLLLHINLLTTHHFSMGIKNAMLPFLSAANQLEAELLVNQQTLNNTEVQEAVGS